MQTSPEMTGNNDRNIYLGARLIGRVLYSILSAWVNLDSLKSRACITLAMLSFTLLQTDRQGVDINCQKEPIRGYTRSWYTGIRFLIKTMLTGSPDLPFFPTRPHSSPTCFFSPPLTESPESLISPFSLPDPTRRPLAFSVLHWQRAWNRLFKQ